jgi:hypothetical protein
MAARKTSVENSEATSAEAARASGTIGESVGAAPSGASPQDEQIVQEIRELRDLVASLANAVEGSQARTAQRVAIETTTAEIRQLARAIPYAGVSRPVETPAVEDDGDDCGCGCIDSSCCCFEIVLDKVRAIQPQREPADMGDTGPLLNELEVRIFAAIDNVGVLIPSLWTTMRLRVPSFLAGGGPGHWVSLNNTVISRVYLKKGTSKVITVDFQAAEVDEGLERPLGMKDEYGTASGSITIDCCASRTYPPMPTDLSFDFGGTGGGVPGAISLAFYARRVCC